MNSIESDWKRVLWAFLIYATAISIIGIYFNALKLGVEVFMSVCLCWAITTIVYLIKR